MRERAAPANDQPQEAEIFGDDAGHPVLRLTIRSQAGAEARILTWGAVIQDLVIPIPGGYQRVVLGFPDFPSYRDHSPYFGAVVGRYANRIGRGRFSLDGNDYRLDLNESGRQTLHGGAGGFSQRVWTVVDHDARSIALDLVSPDGDQGFPGRLTVRCTYRFVGDATLRMELTAVCDRATVVNLAQHSYFNLDGTASVLDHGLQVTADGYTPVDADLVPTGAIAPVDGTPLDFRQARSIRRETADGTLFAYDHNFVLNSGGGPAGTLRHAARLTSPKNSLSLSVSTSEPGLQVYDGHQLALSVVGLDGTVYGRNAGICLEAQHFPDSPNQPAFPSTVLRAGETYRQTTEYRFDSAGGTDEHR